MAQVAEATLTQWVFNAPDARVEDAVITLEFDPAQDLRRASVRGLWKVDLVQRSTSGAMESVTQQVQVRDPRLAPFRLGSASQRLTYGAPVFLRLVYSATDGAAPLFWEGVTNLNCTVHLA